MNSDQWKGKWKQAKGELQAKWGKLTDDDVSYINGKRENLIGKIQERYGLAKEEAQRHADEWIESFGNAGANPGVTGMKQDRSSAARH